MTTESHLRQQLDAPTVAFTAQTLPWHSGCDSCQRNQCNPSSRGTGVTRAGALWHRGLPISVTWMRGTFWEVGSCQPDFE